MPGVKKQMKNEPSLMRSALKDTTRRYKSANADFRYPLTRSIYCRWQLCAIGNSICSLRERGFISYRAERSDFMHKTDQFRRRRISLKKAHPIGSYSKGQFYKDTAHLEIGMPYLAFVYTNAVLVRKIDNS